LRGHRRVRQCRGNKTCEQTRPSGLVDLHAFELRSRQIAHVQKKSGKTYAFFRTNPDRQYPTRLMKMRPGYGATAGLDPARALKCI
jgi:hypothetical protein